MYYVANQGGPPQPHEEAGDGPELHVQTIGSRRHLGRVMASD